MVLKDNLNWTLIFDWPRKPEKVNKNISGIGLFVRGVEWTGPLSYETNALYIFIGPESDHWECLSLREAIPREKCSFF